MVAVWSVKRYVRPGVFALFLLLVACGGGNKMSSGGSGDSVAVFASPNMNNGEAVELDLLFVKTYDIVQAFDIVPAKNWFRNREAFLASYVGQIESISHRVSPGEKIVLSRFPAMKRTAAAVFIYANYTSRGKTSHQSAAIEKCCYRTRS